ncbi:amino acid adenylation domain-containing protein [Legionella maioricensis]|uniref:Amino acid adenylation domain-containing protein n=1 Tax=Legionella maioricensis TaxID=2896528 RepID=A0A9X2IAD2_9GAMM|nr:amino acid adenylation domain-containing protein [Legionella maioricensis]MCL9683929.1 amino acid adenylation domain-containing protein [Legionella maioricensis]MCL9688305.1 amino acid adenylation domain-containing protein [Legionella maioricensis]
MKSSDQYPTICSLFEEQVAQYPENTAIYLEDSQVSYDAFNKQANQYARYLQRKGLPLNGIVGIQLLRSYEMLVAIFAVLKAGGAYLPLDPLAPAMRNQTILAESQIKFLIIGNHSLVTTESELDDKNNLQVLNIHEKVSHEKWDNLNLSRGKHDLAYVMYTSGTTGKPKGVMISHQAIINRILWMQNTFPLHHHDVLFHKTHLCFDISVWEICWWSVTGAGVVLLPPQKEHDIKLFVRMIEQYQLSVIHFVPSVLRIFLSYIKEDFSMNRLKSLKYVFASGEALDAGSVNLFNKLFQDQETLLVNLYGPTETTIDVSYFICEKNRHYRTIPIGKPIQNIQFFVLDEQLNLTGFEPGELFISGIGLAEGYLNNPALTQASFLDNPYLPGEKMYRTGDIVCWNKENELLFLGRKDDQVKLHGIRIELGEIQYHLLEHPNIQDAVIICEKVDSLDQRMVAFLIAHNKQTELSSAELKAFLKTRIPDYMVPEHYIWLGALPIKENGKIDKMKLLSFI